MSMHFDNKVHAIWNVFGVDVWITDSIRNLWIVMCVLIIFAIIVRIKLAKFKDVPTGFQNFVELIVETFHNFVAGAMGHEYAHFAYLYFGIFCTIMFSNLMGLFGLRPPTADISTTAAFTVCTFFLIHYMGIKTAKAEYFKNYARPFVFFLPINIIEVLATPISLSFRLFGNILGGFIIMGLIYELFPFYLKIGIPAVLNVYFDIFAGCLQAFIFTILSLTFIREKIPE